MNETPKFNVGQWLPSDQAFYDKWMKQVLKEAEAKENQTLLLPIQRLKDLIESDRYIWNLFQMMFDEVPLKYTKTPIGTPAIHDYKQMLKVLNRIMHKAPDFNTTGLVGFPINAILDYPMATRAGYIAFINPKVNECFRNILDYWGSYLQSPDSTYVLNRSADGWLGDTALQSIAKAGYGQSFKDIFKTPSDNIDDKYGFRS